MNTLKTGVVIVLLLGVSYGVYQIVNAPDPSMIGEEEPLVEFDQNSMQQVSPGEATSPNAFNQRPPSGFSPNLGTDEIALDAPPLDQNPRVTSGMQGSPGLLNTNQQNQENPYATNGRNDNSTNNPAYGGIANNGSIERMGQPSPNNQLVPLPEKPDDRQEPFESFDNAGNVANVSHESQVVAQPIPIGQMLTEVESLVSQGRLRTALEQLSPYQSESISQTERNSLLQWLDYLAFKVIYSPEHHMFQQPYVVKNGDTLYSLAGQWNVPPELIYNINRAQISNPESLIPGTPLKIVSGPFRAEINMSNSEMTIYLRELYAGRFPITIGTDVQLEPGLLRVQSKSNQGATYRTSDGQVLNPGDPQNPYGRYWLDLGSKFCIHEKPQTLPSYDRRGCIQVSHLHAKDVYGILSKDSSIRVTR